MALLSYLSGIHKECIWRRLAQPAIPSKNKDYCNVFIHQQNVRKRKPNNLKINASASSNLKPMTLKEVMHILFVSTCSRGKHWQFGAREKPVKKINIDGPGREKVEAMGMGRC